MDKKYILALDQGTSSSRAIVFDHDGNICSTAQMEFPQYFPRPGWVEHDPMEIWSSEAAVIAESISKIGIGGKDIAAIGITNQRETTIVWDAETGLPVHKAIVWQDRRTSPFCDSLKEQGLVDTIREKTGLIIDAYFSGTKIKWILDHVPGARERARSGKLRFGTVDSWLVWQLTRGAVHVTDVSNASRTMLFNINTLEWDQELLDLFDIPLSMMPSVRSSSEVYGHTKTTIFAHEVPIAGIAGDQQAALFGQMCTVPGSVKNTYGTGCFLLMNTGREIVESRNGLVTSIAVGFPDHVEYALEGSVFVAGAAIQWLRDELSVISTASESSQYAERVPDSAGGYVVPAFTGLGAPYWNQRARGCIVGLTRGFNRAHLVRATLESLAYQTYDVVRAMERDAGIHIAELKVDGGACANDFLMQFQSDLIGSDVIRPRCIETTALGAAYLAGLAVGFWQSLDDVKNNWSVDRVFTSSMEEEHRKKLLHGWHKAVDCALLWSEEDA